jgi:hypothetical protein
MQAALLDIVQATASTMPTSNSLIIQEFETVNSWVREQVVPRDGQLVRRAGDYRGRRTVNTEPECASEATSTAPPWFAAIF